ncbi:MAG: TadE/TadG family type IV pilus assembly protein [Streptosporangiaceae bacterium]
MQRRRSGNGARDRGAAAVEFALLLPLLLLIVFGIIDFGRALNAQITLTQAAREGARLEALDQPNVVSRTQAAATGLSNVSVSVVTACPVGAGTGLTNAVVKVTYTFSFITPVGSIAEMFGGAGYGAPITMTAQGTIPCET